MCGTCGCDDGEAGSSGHEHEHEYEPDVPVPILSASDAIAARIRDRLLREGVLALNIVGTPGAGKTALLAATIDRARFRAGVVVADLATDNDARRLRRPGVTVEAVETGTSCHLTPLALERAIARLPLGEIDVLFIENVGNLVCPALFDLGEAAKVVVLSVTEGADKPEKYPVMFARAEALVVNKLDLLPYVDFDLRGSALLARRIRPEIDVLTLSARTGEGIERWLEWIERLRRRTLEPAARVTTAS